MASGSGYDRIISLFGHTIAGFTIAFVSIVAALIVGLPLRLHTKLRPYWLAHGELTVLGVIVGFAVCCLLIALAPVATVTDRSGTYQVREPIAWALYTAWALFAFSVAHFIWPQRRRPANT